MADSAVKKDIILEDIRISRVSLAKPFEPKVPQVDPRTNKPKVSKYHIDGILKPDHRQIGELQALIRAVAAAGWGDKAQSILDMIKGNNQRFCFQRGDLYRPGKPAYAGMLYISAGNETQPTIGATINGVNVFNRGTPTILTPADDKWPYDGSYCNVHLQFYTYDFNGSPGLGCSVLGVLFNHHDERLTGATVSSGKEFGVVVGDADKPAPAAAASGSGGLI
jgi:Protein of unknown function (DUF2815)